VRGEKRGGTHSDTYHTEDNTKPKTSRIGTKGENENHQERVREQVETRKMRKRIGTLNAIGK